MTELATLDEEWHGEVPVASIAGEIDASNVASLAVRLRGLLTNRSRGLVVDLTGTTYLDSTGIALLFELAAELRERQQRLLLVVAERSPIGRMIAITGLDRTANVHHALDGALAEAGAGA